MTHISLDTNRCAGHALCAATAPEVYDLDDDGYCVLPSAEVPDSDKPAAIRGAAACPEQALVVD